MEKLQNSTRHYPKGCVCLDCDKPATRTLVFSTWSADFCDQHPKETPIERRLLDAIRTMWVRYDNPDVQPTLSDRDLLISLTKELAQERR